MTLHHPRAEILKVSTAARALIVVLAALGLLDAASPAAAQTRAAQSEEQLLNWYYGAVFGTGVYRTGDRTVSVLQIPFSHEFQPRTGEQYGLKLNVPVSFGFYDFRFDELLDGQTPHSVSTVSVFPGIEFGIPVADNWLLTPYANAGRGWELSGSDSAWIYAAGVKSRLSHSIGSDSVLSLGNQLTFSGYRPDGAPNQPLGLFVVGLNLEIPTNLELWDHPTRVGYHLIYYYYFSRLPYPRSDNVNNKISEEGEIGISLYAPKPISMKLFDLDRVGLAFRVGGGIQAVRLFFSLPY
jgi:hypothetical protein